METTVREAITKHQGISHRIMGIFNSHYDQIMRELWIECQKCSVPEDGEAIREFFEEYMEEDMGFPPMVWEDFMGEFGVKSDDTPEVKTTPAPEEKEEVPEVYYNIPVRVMRVGLPQIGFISRENITPLVYYTGYLQVKKGELKMGIDTYVKYLASIIARGEVGFSEQYLCSTLIPDIVERIFTMLYLVKVNNLANSEAIHRYIGETRNLVNILKGRLSGDDIEEKMVVLDTQQGQIMDYYKNLVELYN